MSAPKQPAYTDTVSAEAREALTPLLNRGSPPRMPFLVMRTLVDQVQKSIIKRRKVAGVTQAKATMGGVPVRVFTRTGVDPGTPARMLINLHGGGFEVDSGSRTETIPLAARMDAVVIGVLYRLAPQHPWPAAVDDALAVYREALKTRPPGHIAIYGASAGAILTAQILVRLKVEGLPMPGAAGIFSGSGDFARTGDCEAFLPEVLAGQTANEILSPYVGNADRTNPLVSPLYGDLSGLPPTLLLTSTRDQLLSQTVILHRALRKADVAAELEVFDGVPHAFWSWVDCPETEDAFDTMAKFFDRNLAR
jgi:acetyl esterase/lipase